MYDMTAISILSWHANRTARFHAEMNTILVAVKNLNGGAATFPVLFLVAGYIKLRWDHDNPDFERNFYFLGKGRFWALLAVVPIVTIFAAATITALVPSPADWSANFMGSLIQLILGPMSISAVFIYCHVIFNRWRARNPNDTSCFNAVTQTP